MTRGEVIIRSAEERADGVLRRLRRMAFGDLDYHREAVQVERMEEEARLDPPPPKRSWRLRLYGWNKRLRGK